MLQYKQRCSELESQIPGGNDDLYRSYQSTTTTTRPQAIREFRDEDIDDLDTALVKLAEEKSRLIINNNFYYTKDTVLKKNFFFFNRNAKLIELNANLKEQLEESHQTNEGLTNDLQKLSSEWDSLREEMTGKEEEWKEEEVAFNDYYNAEHNRLLNLWRDVVSVKRLFTEMKFSTERELAKMRGCVNVTINDTISACGSTGFLAKLQQAAQFARGNNNNNNEEQHQVNNNNNNNNSAEEIRKLEATHLAEIRAKDDRIQQLVDEVYYNDDRFR